LTNDDRQKLRDLVEAYARAADRRDYKGVAALFADNGRLVVYRGKASTGKRVQDSQGREEIERALHVLNNMSATMHFIGQHYVDVSGDSATGEAYCLAFHIYDREGVSRDTMMAIRYIDRYARLQGEWLFEERTLEGDFTEDRPIRIT
jgi:ketosteroid isomerase-like protein